MHSQLTENTEKVVFSIVAKNYISLANTLGDSIKLLHPDLLFFIVVADPEDNETKFEKQRYPIISSSLLSVARLEEMAFKYNVTEFCTALKPYAFDYFLKKGVQKVIYFDPDIYVFSNLDKIFSNLSDSSIVITPHICTLQDQYTGLVPEGMLMHVGIFNLGFCGISNNANGRKIIDWWKIRLADQCYADKIDGLHTDQKWIDFLPSLIDNIYIERGLGYNMAIWNWHEREIEFIDGQYFVKNRICKSESEPLVFFHFSNFNFKNASDPEAFLPKYIRKFSDLYDVSIFYGQKLLVEQKHNIGHSQSSVYTYDTYSNGVAIIPFHRRLFRRLIETGHEYKDPFCFDKPGGLYELLDKNNLINSSTRKASKKINEENFSSFSKNIRYIQRISIVMKFLIGINNYELLCKFAQRFVRYENQTFLIKEVRNSIPFYNENRYINWEVPNDKKTI